MKYEVKVSQTRKNDTSDYDFTDSVVLVFDDRDGMYTFLDLVGLNSKKTTIEIKYIKKEH